LRQEEANEVPVLQQVGIGRLLPALVGPYDLEIGAFLWDLLDIETPFGA
jgi:hypothetical protein